MNKRPIDYCHWIVPGKLLAGEYPRNLDHATSQAKVDCLLQAGVEAFIDLTEEGELCPYKNLIGSATYKRFPIRDVSVPESPDFTASVLDVIDEQLSLGRTVYVHCWGGRGRTGTIIGCWLARHGAGGADGLARLKELWQANPKSENSESPETDAQIQYVLNWKAGQ